MKERKFSMSFTLTLEQAGYLESKKNSSEYIRKLIDEDMTNEETK